MLMNHFEREWCQNLLLHQAGLSPGAFSRPGTTGGPSPRGCGPCRPKSWGQTSRLYLGWRVRSSPPPRICCTIKIPSEQGRPLKFMRRFKSMNLARINLKDQKEKHMNHLFSLQSRASIWLHVQLVLLTQAPPDFPWWITEWNTISGIFLDYIRSHGTFI